MLILQEYFCCDSSNLIDRHVDGCADEGTCRGGEAAIGTTRSKSIGVEPGIGGGSADDPETRSHQKLTVGGECGSQQQQVAAGNACDRSQQREGGQ